MKGWVSFMKSRFVIKTEEQVLTANGAIVPPVNVEVEAEYDLSDVAGMYELYKKVLKELPGIKADMEKIFAGFGVAKEEEKEEEHEAPRKARAPKEYNNVIGVIETAGNIYIIQSINEKVVKTICVDNDEACDVSKIIRCIFNVLEKDKRYYFYLGCSDELKIAIRDYVDEHPSIMVNLDKSFNNCRKGRIQFVPVWVSRYMADLADNNYSFL